MRRAILISLVYLLLATACQQTDGCGGPASPGADASDSALMGDQVSGAVPKPYVPPNPLGLIRWVRLEGGAFVQGSPVEESCRHDDETQHEVVITQPFAMMQREVTEAQWETLMGNNPTESVPWHICPGKLNCPVNRVSWLDTLAFANALSDRAGLEPCYLLEGCAGEPGNHGDHVFECTRAELVDSCRGFRLPTEAEWEFAARAGTVTTFPCGNDERCLEGKEVLLGEPGADPLGPSVVGSRQPNPWGLYDMLGNVGEWVWDLHGPYPDSAVTDPLGATQTASGSHVFRGGAFYVDPCNSRPAVRYAGRPGWRDEGVGFRLVRTLTKSR